jgi:hypothetical protein
MLSLYESERSFARNVSQKRTYMGRYTGRVDIKAATEPKNPHHNTCQPHRPGLHSQTPQSELKPTPKSSKNPSHRLHQLALSCQRRSNKRVVNFGFFLWMKSKNRGLALILPRLIMLVLMQVISSLICVTPVSIQLAITLMASCSQMLEDSQMPQNLHYCQVVVCELK